MMDINIREYKLEDAESHFVAVKASIESLSKWFTWAKPDYCLCESIQFMKDQADRKIKGQYDYVVFDSDDNQYLGSCSFTLSCESGETTATMHYWRRQDTCKHKIMEPALRQVIEKAYKHGATRIWVDIAHCNPASIQVALSNGAKPEKDIPIKGGDGKIHKGTRYIILKRENN